MSEQAKFLQGSLFKHIAVMSFTASIGLMAIFVVDVVDMIFISMLGNAALAAAVGYAGAILFFTTSFGIGMSIATGALVARALGQGDGQLAEEKASSTMIYGVIFGVLFSAAVWLNVPFLAGLVGAEGETLELATGYLRIIIPSFPLLLIGMVGSAVLRAHGAARQAMFATIAGGVVNAILDPIFIFVLDMGLNGAATASVFARLAIAVVALVPVFRHYGGIHLPPVPRILADFRPLAMIAVPAILTQLATPIGSAYVTRAMAEFGETAVAGMAIVARITPVAFGTIFALSGAIGPIIGQNFGAGLHDRVALAFREGMLFILAVVLVMTATLFIFRAPIADLFGAQGMARELVFLFCGPLALAFFFNGQIFVANAAFNNLGHPFYSTWINWGRQTLGTVPFVLLFAGWFGAPGVLIGQAAGGIIFGLVAWWLALRVLREPKDGAKHAFHGHRRLHQLLHHRR